MNQILVTGDEQVTEQVAKKVTEKVKKQKNVAPINGVVVFYAIFIIILGICMISGSVYAKVKITETVEASIRPEISVERNDEDNTLKINVTHIRGIESVTYRWNSGEETLINGRNKTSVTETIDLIGGENTLKISVTEENGQIKTFEKTFIAGTKPEIELNNVNNGIQIKISSEEKINYIQYAWDDGEMQKVEVGQKKYEGIINALKGKHVLKIEVVDINGYKYEEEKTIIGDVEPTVKIQSLLVNGKATFVIDAEDDESIKTISIIHNSGEEQVIDVNAKTYHHEVTMTEGEVNTIIVKVTNKNDLTAAKGAKFTNKL